MLPSEQEETSSRSGKTWNLDRKLVVGVPIVCVLLSSLITYALTASPTDQVAADTQAALGVCIAERDELRASLARRTGKLQQLERDFADRGARLEQAASDISECRQAREADAKESGTLKFRYGYPFLSYHEWDIEKESDRVVRFSPRSGKSVEQEVVAALYIESDGDQEYVVFQPHEFAWGVAPLLKSNRVASRMPLVKGCMERVYWSSFEIIWGIEDVSRRGVRVGVAFDDYTSTGETPSQGDRMWSKRHIPDGCVTEAVERPPRLHGELDGEVKDIRERLSESAREARQRMIEQRNREQESLRSN